ncbi:DUF4344 domain-containing metallopeptidase [Thiolinea disciformis]|uniref:DUF4344 domain-containing metallopeptidase n=1 Tax=Thiolinea disciformis TaxID=125614 RepID=UPI00037A0C8B|nr:DUF4344 domain-containing metallopeptidase [Thiolinea disciformis]
MLKLLKILGFCVLLASSQAYAKEDLAVVYQPSKTAQAMQQDLQQSESLKALFSTLNAHFKFPKGLKVVFSDEDDAAYDPERSEIIMSYAFVTEIKALFSKAKADLDISPTEAAIQTLSYMLIHEVAHALIDRYALPVVGKEEDAADGLASVILSEYFEDGQETILDAAGFFDLVSADRKVLNDEDLWDEHSLDEQRLYTSLCHVYGSDPKKYAAVKKIAGFPTERAELCEEEYANLANSWNVLLKPYRK